MYTYIHLVAASSPTLFKPRILYSVLHPSFSMLFPIANSTFLRHCHSFPSFPLFPHISWFFLALPPSPPVELLGPVNEVRKGKKRFCASSPLPFHRFFFRLGFSHRLNMRLPSSPCILARLCVSPFFVSIHATVGSPLISPLLPLLATAETAPLFVEDHTGTGSCVEMDTDRTTLFHQLSSVAVLGQTFLFLS